ncbi:MAG: BrnT family toxin [Gammaproteobacteria bacterium]|nr:BrnT family toxin [Gammaproteobacteria bacterium]
MDFVTAQDFWNDSDIVRVKTKSNTEPRYLVIARMAGKYWSAVITCRGETIRIISVRHSRKPEVQLYES